MSAISASSPPEQPIESVYDSRFDLSQVPRATLDQWGSHGLSSRTSVTVTVALYFLTLGVATTIAGVRQLSRLPQIEPDDMTGHQAIRGLLVPYYNVWWAYRLWYQFAYRLSLQFRLRGQPGLRVDLVNDGLLAITAPLMAGTLFLAFEAPWFPLGLLLAPYSVSWFSLGIFAPYTQSSVNKLVLLPAPISSRELAHIESDSGADSATPESPPARRRSRLLLLKARDAVFLYFMLDPIERNGVLATREEILERDPQAAEREGWLFPSSKGRGP